MDPQELGRLRDFSDTLTHVLAQLDGKFRELNSGGTKLLAINSTLEKHASLLQNLEKSREEQSKTIHENLQKQTELSRDVLDVTSRQCIQIQNNLVDLRSSTKSELDKLHGHLKLTFFESLEEILSKTYTPAAEFPTITRDMAPEKILSIMNGRINTLEAQMKIQSVTNQALKGQLSSETQIHDRFDELSSKIVQLERTIDSERRKISKIEKQVAQLLNSQGNVDRSLKLVDQKISLLTSAHFSGISSYHPSGHSASDPAQSAMLQVLQTPLPDLNEPSEGISLSNRGTIRDPAKIQSMKSFLREKKMSMRAEGSGASSPSRPSSHVSPHQPRATLLNPQLSSLQDFEDDVGASSVDSQGLLDEYVLERIENLDTIVNDTLLNKVNATEKLSRQLTHDIKTVQDSVKELEIISTDLTTKGNSASTLMDFDYNLLLEKNFKSLTFDLKEQWEKVWDEIERKISRIDTIMKQTDTLHESAKGNSPPPSQIPASTSPSHASNINAYDDITKKLVNFKNKIRTLFESFSQCIESPEGKEAILATLTPCLNDLLRESHEVLRTEVAIKDAIQNKIPGVPLPISYISNKLPELLKTSQKKTVQFLNKGINKLDLLSSILSLQETITTLVPQTIFQQNNEDLKIALTLKADQKTVDSLQLKKASLIDLQKFREYVNDEIDSMRETLVKNASNNMKLLSNITAAAGGGQGGADQHELNDRFNIIISQFQDLKRSIAGYVPRPEIETALQAILDEIRIIKRVSVEKDQLNEKLKMKADRDEIDRLLNLLSSSVGLPGSNSAIAMHLKCLSCDKPINPFLVDTTRPNSQEEEVTWARDMNDSPKARPNTTSAATFGKGALLNSKSTSQLPPVGSNPATSHGDRQSLKSRQGINKGSSSGYIAPPGIQGSYMSRA